MMDTQVPRIQRTIWMTAGVVSVVSKYGKRDI